jgi:hypothetical protein
MRHVIVCGYPRSGTTMLYNMLCRNLSGYTAFDKEVAATKVIGLNQGNIISKSPLDLFKLEQVARANTLGKDILLLITIRDIRSIITSYNAAVPDDYFIAYDHCYSPDYKGNTPYNGPGIIRTAHAIGNAVQSKHFQSIIVRYEDLICSPRAEQDRIQHKAGMSFSGRFEDFHKGTLPEGLTRQLNGQRPLDKTRLDAWRRDEHAQRIRSQFTRCPALFDLLIAYGYEKNRDWFDVYRRDHPRLPAEKDDSGYFLG